MDPVDGTPFTRPGHRTTRLENVALVAPDGSPRVATVSTLPRRPKLEKERVSAPKASYEKDSVRVFRATLAAVLRMTEEIRAQARATPGPHTATIEKLTNALDVVAAMAALKGR